MTNPSQPRRVVVLGAASAIAEAACRLLAQSGAHIALIGRDEARLKIIAADLKLRGAEATFTLARDLAATDDPAATLELCAREIGAIDTVLIFYGVLGDQSRAEVELSEARRLLNVNFTSPALWALAAVPHVENAGARGVILTATSVAGDRGRRSNFIYGAAKGGLSVLMQGLAHRFGAKPGGPRAVDLKLGFVDTPMTAHLPKGGPLWATPAGLAPIIVAALERGGPVVYAPWFWRFVMLAIRLTPHAIFKRVNL